MTAYENLLQEAYDNNIEVIEFTFKSSIKGLYSYNVIALNKYIDTTAEKKCTLCEEIEHAYTTSGNILDMQSIQNRKQENIARNSHMKD